MEKQLNCQDKEENPKENKLKPVHGILLFVVVTAELAWVYTLACVCCSAEHGESSVLNCQIL